MLVYCRFFFFLGYQLAFWLKILKVYLPIISFYVKINFKGLNLKYIILIGLNLKYIKYI